MNIFYEIWFQKPDNFLFPDDRPEEEPEPEVTPEKHTAVLDVRLHAHPDTTVTWYKDGKPVEETGDSRIHSTYSVFDRHLVYTLLIDDVTITDAGQYLVRAIGPAGEVAEHVSELSVAPMDIEPVVPRFIGEQETRVEARPGDIAQFDAQIEATADTNVTWFKDGIIVEEDFRKTMTVANFDTVKVACLSIADVCVEDSGKYCLRAENELGFALFTAELSVVEGRDQEDSFNFYLAPQMQQLDSDWDCSKEFVDDRGMQSAVVESRGARSAAVVQKYISDVQGRSRNLEQDWNNLEVIDNAEHFVAGSLQQLELQQMFEKDTMSQSILTGIADERQVDEWEFDNDLDDVEPIFIATQVEIDNQENSFAAQDFSKQSLAFGNYEELPNFDQSYLLNNVESEAVLGQIFKEEVLESTELNIPMQASMQSLLKAVPVDTYVDWHEGNQGDWTFDTDQTSVFEADFKDTFQVETGFQSVSSALALDAFQNWSKADEQNEEVLLCEQTQVSNVADGCSDFRTETNIVMSTGVSKFDCLDWQETHSDDGQHQEVSQGILDSERRSESPSEVKQEKTTLFGINADDLNPVMQTLNELSTCDRPHDMFTEAEHYEAPMEVSVFSAAIQLNYSQDTELAEEKLDSLLDLEERPLESLIVNPSEQQPEKSIKFLNVSFTEESNEEEFLLIDEDGEQNEAKLDTVDVCETIETSEADSAVNFTPFADETNDNEIVLTLEDQSEDFAGSTTILSEMISHHFEVTKNDVSETLETVTLDDTEKLDQQDESQVLDSHIASEMIAHESEFSQNQVDDRFEDITKDDITGFEADNENQVLSSDVGSDMIAHETDLSENQVDEILEVIAKEDIGAFEADNENQVWSSDIGSDMVAHETDVSENQVHETREEDAKDDTGDFEADNENQVLSSDVGSDMIAHETDMAENQVDETHEDVAKDGTGDFEADNENQVLSSDVGSAMIAHETDMAENQVDETHEDVAKDGTGDFEADNENQVLSSDVGSAMIAHETDMAENQVDETHEDVAKDGTGDFEADNENQVLSSDVGSDMIAHDTDMAKNQVDETHEDVAKDGTGDFEADNENQVLSSDVGSDMIAHETDMAENQVDETNEDVDKDGTVDFDADNENQVLSSYVGSDMIAHETDMAENQVDEKHEDVAKDGTGDFEADNENQVLSSDVGSDMIAHETDMAENQVDATHEDVAKDGTGDFEADNENQVLSSDVGSDMIAHVTDMVENQIDETHEDVAKDFTGDFEADNENQVLSSDVGSDMIAHETDMAENQVDETHEDVAKDGTGDFEADNENQVLSSDVGSDMIAHETDMVENQVDETLEDVAKDGTGDFEADNENQVLSSDVGSDMIAHETDMAENQVDETHEDVAKDGTGDFEADNENQVVSSDVGSDMVAHETDMSENQVDETFESIVTDDTSDFDAESLAKSKEDIVGQECGEADSEVAQNRTSLFLEENKEGSLYDMEEFESMDTWQKRVSAHFESADSESMLVTADEASEFNEAESVKSTEDLVAIETDQDFVADEFAMNDYESVENLCDQTNESVKEDNTDKMADIKQSVASEWLEEDKFHSSQASKAAIKKGIELQMSEVYDSIASFHFQTSADEVSYEEKSEPVEEVEESIEPSVAKRHENQRDWSGLDEIVKKPLDGEDIQFEQDKVGEFALEFQPIKCEEEEEEEDKFGEGKEEESVCVRKSKDLLVSLLSEKSTSIKLLTAVSYAENIALCQSNGAFF